MKIKSFITFLVLLISCSSVPGAIQGQSVFGLNFLGEHRFTGNARNAALGYSGLAMPDTSNAITMNPASLADLSKVTFSLFEVMSISRTRFEDVLSNQTRFQLPAAAVAIPLRKGLVFSFGYRTSFEGKADFLYERESGISPSPYEQYKLNSSLFAAPFTVSWKPVDWLMVSGELQLNRGSIKDEVHVYFDDMAYNKVTSVRTRGFSGNSWAASVLTRVHPRLWLGATYDESIEYCVEENMKYSMSTLNTFSSWDFTLPSAYSVGLAAGLTDRWWFTSSFWTRKAPEPVGFEQFEDALGDESLLAFGLERRAASEHGFMSRIPLRIGFYRNRWHIEFPAGEPVISTFFTCGSGFPFPGGAGNLDFTLEFGKIGSITGNGIDEKVVRFGVSISLSEAWSRRKIDTH